MNLLTIQRWGGVSIIAGSLLYACWAILYATLLPLHEYSRDFTLMILSPHWTWISAIALPGTILMIFGFTAIYSRLFSSAGVFGFIAYIFVVTAFLFQMATITWEIFLYPPIAHFSPAIPLFREGIFMRSGLFQLYDVLYDGTIGIGIILFSITLLRSREFPKYAGVMFFGGVVAYAIGSWINVYAAVTGVLVLSAGCLALGKRMFSPSVDMSR